MLAINGLDGVERIKVPSTAIFQGSKGRETGCGASHLSICKVFIHDGLITRHYKTAAVWKHVFLFFLIN